MRGRDCNRNTYGNPRLSTGECAIVGYTANIQMEVRTAAVNEAGTMVSLAGRLGATNPRIDRFFLAGQGDPPARCRAGAGRSQVAGGSYRSRLGRQAGRSPQRVQS